MPESTRRGFLKVAGAGVAVAGVATAVPAALHRADTPAKVVLPSAASGSLMAYIHDVKKGELAVMVEGREVTVTDHELVARLAHVLHAKGSNSL